MSKQSNQRYRKEKAKRQGLETKATPPTGNSNERNKINREFTSSDKTDQ